MVRPKKEERNKMMNEKIVEIEAKSLEAAKEQLMSQITEDRYLVSEQIISDGVPKTVKAIADTSEVAFAKAQGEIPNDVDILEKKELISPVQKVITVEAFDKHNAESRVRSKLRDQFDDNAVLQSLRMTVAGRKGFFGVGKKSNQYEAEIRRQAMIEITYKPKVKISAKIGKKLTPDEQRQLIEVIATELESRDQDVRDASIRKLEQIDTVILTETSESLVVPLVVAARWGHKYNDDVSRTAVNVLVKMGESAVQPLSKLLKGDNYGSAHIACIALAKMGNSTHAPHARAKLGAHVKQIDNEYKSFDAITAMAEIGDEYIVDFLTLVALKTHSNELVRAHAAVALGQIGDKRAVQALTKSLQDPSWQNVRPSVEWALQKLR